MSSAPSASSAPAKKAAEPRRKPRAAAPAAESAASDANLRIIKKYPNRRLYDTRTSSYVTLAEVKALVMGGEAFQVHDAKTGEDLTRAILLQIILEEEAGGTPMFSEAALANIIRFYGHAMQGFMGNYMEKNIQAFAEMQSGMAERAKGWSPETWSAMLNPQTAAMQKAMSAYMEKSQGALTQMQDQLQKQTEQMLTAFGIKR